MSEPTPQQLAVILRLLAGKVYAARMRLDDPRGTIHLRDASDFRQWLFELAELAAISTTIEDFIAKI